MRKDESLKAVCSLAIPVALQSMLQSSFSMVDQIMIGQLGEISVAGVGLAGKFASIYSVVISAIGAVTGIMISQYFGQKNNAEVRRSIFVNLLLGALMAVAFAAVCALFSSRIMGIYTSDERTRQAAAEYLALMAGTFLPMAGATLLSTAFRCAEKPQLPLYASILSAILNTGLNYILIFGRLGAAAMGAKGAAVATVVSQCANFLVMLLMARKALPVLRAGERWKRAEGRLNWRQCWTMLLPMLVCEVAWSLGENAYAAIYGHMGTDASAAMTLINPIQGLVIGALCGLSQAASVIVGKRLGSEDYENAYRACKKLIVYGAVGSVALSAVVLLTSGLYVRIYRVAPDVKILTRQILAAYAIIAPFKVLNMILGGGILRSGGRTKYVMFIDTVGTWFFGVPLGLVSAFVLKLPVPWVYFILSLEECVRFSVSLVVFCKKKWMNRLKAGC